MYDSRNNDMVIFYLGYSILLRKIWSGVNYTYVDGLKNQ